MMGNLFKKVYIEITNICNLSCSFCSPVKRKKEFMSIQNFEYIIEQIKPHCNHIFLHVKGEPLMHPNIVDILNICSDNNIKVDITTNGTLLLQNTELLLNHPVRQINVSLHSFEGDNSFKYLSDVATFARNITSKTQTVVVLREWVMAIENEEIKNFLSNEFNLCNIDIKRSTKLADNIFLNQAEQFDWPNLDMPHISNRGFCYGLRSHVAILVDGTVVPCCLDSDGIINLGNIFETPFLDIVKSPRALSIANSFSKRHAAEELCRKCTYKERFTHGQRIN